MASNIETLASSAQNFNSTLSTSVADSVNTLAAAFNTGTQTLAQSIADLGRKASQLKLGVDSRLRGNDGLHENDRLGGNDSLQAASSFPRKWESMATKEGLRIKGGTNGQAFAGGKTEAGVLALAQSIQSSIKGINRFTAFNDKYHAGTSSKHASGLALDLSILNPSQSAQIAQAIRDLGQQVGVKVKVLDEYKNPSARSTGGHIHAQFNTKAEADKFAEAVSKVGTSVESHAAAVNTLKASTTTTATAFNSTQSSLNEVAQAADLTAHSSEIAAQATQLKAETDEIAAQASQMGVQAKTQETVASTQVAVAETQQTRASGYLQPFARMDSR